MPPQPTATPPPAPQGLQQLPSLPPPDTGQQRGPAPGPAGMPAVVGTAAVGLFLSIYDRQAPTLSDASPLNQSQAVVESGDDLVVRIEDSNGSETKRKRLTSDRLAPEVAPGVPVLSE